MKSTVSAGALAVLVFAAINFASPVVAHAGPNTDYSRSELGGNSGLAIFRVADYGNHNGLAIYIDGIPIVTLSRGEGYRAIVRPGHHVIKVLNTPSPYGKTYFTERRLHFAPGQNYSFTAMWDVETVTLEDGGYMYRGFYRPFYPN
jgi:hypothetical protein